MKKFILFIPVLLLCNFLSAQQLPQFTSFQLNPFLYNPAYAGVDGTTQLSAVTRNQWVGVNDAPETKVLNAYGMLNNEKMAIGGTVYKDVAAADSRLTFLATYAYHLRLKKDMNLSLGLAAGFVQYKIDNTIINHIDEGDPLFATPLSSVVPTATFGAYLYTEDYYVSFSAPQIISSAFNVKDKLEEDVLFGELTNHFYLGGGYNKVLNDKFTVQPSLLVIMSPPAPVSLELMAKVTYDRKVWIALSYRLDDSAGLFLGYDLNDQFYIAYGHDFVTSSLSTATSGSNEFKLGFKFNKASKK